MMLEDSWFNGLDLGLIGLGGGIARKGGGVDVLGECSTRWYNEGQYQRG